MDNEHKSNLQGTGNVQKTFNVAMFSSKSYDRKSFAQHQISGIKFTYFDERLNSDNVQLCSGFDAICAFVNDDLSADILHTLAKLGVRFIALRCAGFNNLDLDVAKTLNIKVARVPAYSPEAVAEHAIALMMTLNRKLHKAYNRTKEDNFSLNGLLGFNIHGKTVGLIGTGKIGLATAKILQGFGAKVIAFDPYPEEAFTEIGGTYVELDQLFTQSHIISLHCPLNENTQHIINAASLAKTRQGLMIVNTSRGGLIDTKATIEALKTGQLGYLALDVYEQESELFFEDRSGDIIQDDTFQRLLTFPNVLITGHQGFFTAEALEQIAKTTWQNLFEFQQTGICSNQVS